MLGFVKYKHLSNIYPAFNIRIFLLLGLAGLGVVMFYNFVSLNVREAKLQDNFKLSSMVKLAYIIFPFFIAIIIFFIIGNEISIETIFVLPVLFTATVIGKKASYVMSTICSAILIFYQVDIQMNPLVASFESRIFIIGTMYMSGWFVGGLMEIEAQHRKQLKENMLSLEEEMARREQMEKEMARLDRLNLIGEMAAGFGHEIRNPMTTVRGFLQIIGKKEKHVQEKEYFDLMIKEMDRANSIITEFLSLAKNKAVNIREQSLNSIIESFYPLLQADALNAEKNIQKQLGEIPQLLLDEKEICQLILNLVRNGFEAMPTGGKLIIRTMMDGGEAVLAVQDEGTGIAAEVLGKMGTPFFTTKDQGTGLGLAVCYSIAARHKARIDLETTPAGTTFYVRFKPIRSPRS
jgi:signal transduction histidine kinase